MTTTTKCAEELADIVTSIIVAPYEGENAEVIASKSRGVLVKLFGQYLLAAEQRAQHGWRTDVENAPKGVPVLVPGGLAMRKTGDEWFTGMEEPLYQRPIQWTVTHWMPLPSAPNTPDAGITATDYQRGFADGVAKVVSYHRNQFQYYSRMNQHHYADWHLICANTIEAKNMGETQ